MARWITSWNQDRWERYQQPQKCRWYHFNGRKWRGTKELLNELKKESKKAGLKLNIQKTKITASSPITSWQIDGENVETASDISFWAPKSIRLWLQPWNFKKRLFLGRIAMSSPDSVLKSRHHFANKGPYSQSYVFPSSRVWMWELGYKKSWALKHLHFWTMVLEKTLESPLHCKEIKPVHPKRNKSWIFIGWTDAEAEAPILW